MSGVASLLDSGTGVIKRLVRYPLCEGFPPLHIVMAEFLSPARISSPDPGSIGQRAADGWYAHGASYTEQKALDAAVGEALERYSGHLADTLPFVSARYDELGHALNPGDIISYSPEQYSRPEFRIPQLDMTRTIRWVQGYNHTANSPAHIPASLVVLGLDMPDTSEMIVLPTSSGLAAGPDKTTALLSALQEIVERDSFMCHWQTHLTPRAISATEAAARLPSGLLPFLDNYFTQLCLLDITTDLGIPAALAVLRPEAGQGLALGASCRATLRDAAEKAILEAYHTLTWVADMERAGHPPHAITASSDFRDHVDHYRRPDAISMAEFLWTDAVQTTRSLDDSLDAPTPEIHLATLVSRLKAHGYEVYSCDITPAYVRDAGVSVQRVIVPGLQPLTSGTLYQAQDCRRLERFRNALSAENWQLNDEPHPFP